MDELKCGLPDEVPADEEIKSIFEGTKNIAIVGLSDNPERDSHKVAIYLKEKGFNIIPVNPGKSEILGEKSYPDLSSIEEKVDIVDVFRNIEAVPGIVEEAIKINPKTIWLQLGLVDNASAEKARKAGIKFVQSRCTKVEHSRLFGK